MSYILSWVVEVVVEMEVLVEHVSSCTEKIKKILRTIYTRTIMGSKSEEEKVYQLIQTILYSILNGIGQQEKKTSRPIPDTEMFNSVFISTSSILI